MHLLSSLFYRIPNSNESQPEKCATNSLLGLWNYDPELILDLTDEDVLEAVSKALSKSNE